MRPRPLQPMFHGVPVTYDLLNRVLTLGFDQRWRRRAAVHILSHAPRRILDLGCGTGDLALLLAGSDPVPRIVAVDFVVPMLQVARHKSDRHGFRERIGFVCGDAAALPFPSESFDAVGIAFAFRNFTFRNPLTGPVLAELRRILRVGGRLVIVETSQPPQALIRTGFHAYLTAVVAPLGGLISRQAGAYRYLATSARFYYRPEEVSDLLRETGFTVARTEMLLFGTSAIHVAVRP